MASDKMEREMQSELARSVEEHARDLGIAVTDGRVRAWIANRWNTLRAALKRNDWDSVAMILIAVGRSAPTGHTDDLDELERYYERVCYDKEAVGILRGWRHVADA
jgi:hypothetical protein